MEGRIDRGELATSGDDRDDWHLDWLRALGTGTVAPDSRPARPGQYASPRSAAARSGGPQGLGPRTTSVPGQRSSAGHPGLAESLIPVWGSGREAVADFQEGDYAGAALNGALAASDLFLGGSLAKGVAKGGFYVAKNAAKKAPYAWSKEVRPWMIEKGYLKPFQDGHHWAIPQNGWGKRVPDRIKNQPWNIKAMPEGPVGKEIHGRLTNSYKGKPEFNAVQKYIYGTPTWAKVGTGAAVGHPAAAAKSKLDSGR